MYACPIGGGIHSGSRELHLINVINLKGGTEHILGTMLTRKQEERVAEILVRCAQAPTILGQRPLLPPARTAQEPVTPARVLSRISSKKN